MKICALVPWYDEAPSWLAGAVASLAKVGVDHLVAIDGCYALFPGALERPRSFADQATTIIDAAEGLGIGCTVVRPREAFIGNEVEKRNLLFAHGRLVCDVGDWFYCFDSDERVLSAPDDLHWQLENTLRNVAEVRVITPVEPYETVARAKGAPTVGAPHERATGYRCIFRNMPGLSVELAHYIVGYDAADGERSYLRGRSDMFDMEEALDLPGFLVEHRTYFRERNRSAAAKAYYQVRDAAGVERMTRDVFMETPGGGLAAVA